MKVYYRLFDEQTGSYAATGYNVTSIAELKNQYISLIENDSEEEDIQAIKEMSDKAFLSYLKGCEYTVKIIKRSLREEKLKQQINELKKELHKYKKGYEILNCYFDSISDEEQIIVDKQLRHLKLY